MKDKEKQIEFETKQAIAKEIDKVYPNAKFTNGWIAEVLYKLGYRKLPEDSVVYKNGKIYYNGEHIGYIDFSFYEDIKSLGFGNFEIIDKRKGYGTLVIKDIVCKYKDKYNLIYYFVDKDNVSAIEFYKKVGKVCFDITNYKDQHQVILYGKQDSVVLSMEEYEKLKNLSNLVPKLSLENLKLKEEQKEIQRAIAKDNSVNWLLKQDRRITEKRVSKETAEKYHNEIELWIKSCVCMHYISLEHGQALLNDNNKLAKQFGVEIKE